MLAVLAGPETTPRADPARITRPGCERTFDDVYRQGFRFVWRSLRRLGVSPSQVDDALQDVFLIVHRRLDEFEGRSKLETWLFAISFRVAKDYRRTAKRKPTAPLYDEAVPSSGANPAQQAERAEAVELLHSLLDKLDDDKRAVFILSELEQMRGPEIAEALDIPVDTAYSRLKAARALFNQALSRHRARERRPS